VRRRWRSMIGMVALFAILACGVVGCVASIRSNNIGTAPGAYTVAVIGTSGTITETTSITLTVQ
jgi:hypothetical protein